MSRPVSSIRNLGPAMEAAFARVGITSAEQLIALGADDAYARLIATGSRPHFIAYYALVMGLQGRPWNNLDSAEKAALRQRFDALCARSGSEPGTGADRGLDAALEAIGVIPPGRTRRG